MVKETKDFNGTKIKVGDNVITDNVYEQGRITALYDDRRCF